MAKRPRKTKMPAQPDPAVRSRRNLAPNRKVAQQKAERRRGRLSKEESARRKRRMLRALRKTIGNIEAASRECGVPRRTHFYWMKTDTNYFRRASDIIETQKDLVEGQLLANCRAGKERSIFFYLSSRAKDRGYGGIRMNGEFPINVGEGAEEGAEVFTLESLTKKVSTPTIERVLTRLQARERRRNTANA